MFLKNYLPFLPDPMLRQVTEAAVETTRAKRDAEQIIKTYPLATTLSCVTLGVILGWLIKRR